MITIVEFLRARLNGEEVDATHIAQQNPLRVMTDVAVKRLIVDECEGAIEAGTIDPDTTWNDDAAGAVLGERILRCMATAYRAHPDYDPAWAVPRL